MVIFNSYVKSPENYQRVYALYALVMTKSLLFKPWPSRNDVIFPINRMVDLSSWLCKRLPGVNQCYIKIPPIIIAMVYSLW